MKNHTRLLPPGAEAGSLTDLHYVAAGVTVACPGAGGGQQRERGEGCEECLFHLVLLGWFVVVSSCRTDGPQRRALNGSGTLAKPYTHKTIAERAVHRQA